MKSHRTRENGNVSVLTPREAEIMALRKEGKRYKEIAEILGLSEKTVSTMITKARSKDWSLGCGKN